MPSKIVVKGARPQLKNIDVEIPRDKLVVITGVSGSGKSSPSPSIRFTPRGNGGIWSPSPWMPASSCNRWKSRCRYHRRACSGDCRSAKGRPVQSALYRRNPHRDLRLSAAFCAGRSTDLHPMRERDSSADHRADQRSIAFAGEHAHRLVVAHCGSTLKGMLASCCRSSAHGLCPRQD